jgi:HD-GYP domain-containing protein (c-di-GMP phosphodiesterase class II)
VLHHHERWDGQGYPYGLAGEAIPLGARIFAIADTLDAMTSDRPYRKALSFAEAREEIIRCSGKQFDPDMVKLFLEIPEEELRLIREISLANRQQRAAA